MSEFNNLNLALNAMTAHIAITQHFSPDLAEQIGLEAAIVFQKIFDCWKNPKMLGRQEDDIKWIRNPIKCTDSRKIESARSHHKQIDWAGNFPFLSVWQVRQAIAHLERLGLIVSRKLKTQNWDACKFYSVVENKLTELLKPLKSSICELPQIDLRETDRSICGLHANHIHEYNSSKVFQKNLEREARFQDFEKGKDLGTGKEVFGNNQDFAVNEEEFCETPKDSPLDKCSAPAEFAEDKVEVATASVESANWSETELRQFQTQLEEYGRRAGRRNPLGWAFTIVKNLRGGLACTYWEEFKAGVPVGTGDRREWESAPGVPCTAAKQCLEERFLSKPGTTAVEAAIEVSRVLANPQQMAIVWKSIKARVVFLREEWRRLSNYGVQHAVVDPWMRPKDEISDEIAAAALSELQQNLPQQLQASETVLSIEGEEFVGAIESETENLGPEIDIEEQKRNISRLAQLFRGKRGGGANIAPVEPLKCAVDRLIDTGDRFADLEKPLPDDDLLW